jgi:hypothetical protein
MKLGAPLVKDLGTSMLAGKQEEFVEVVRTKLGGHLHLSALANCSIDKKNGY